MKGQTNRSILGPRLQRRLRAAPTEAERILWRRLCRRQLDGCKFRRQHPFRDYILDFVCLDRMVVVEVDGSQHATNVDADAGRTSVLEGAGFLVLRFWNNQVFNDIDGVLEAILQALRGGEHHPHPSPPLEGEGEEL
jgi:very-short-patch-repair endonuclease